MKLFVALVKRSKLLTTLTKNCILDVTESYICLRNFDGRLTFHEGNHLLKRFFFQSSVCIPQYTKLHIALKKNYGSAFHNNSNNDLF